MRCFVGFGSNLGDRRAHLEAAAAALRGLAAGGALRASAVYETAALVPEGAPRDWSRPFLNAVAELEWQGSAPGLLAALKAIESQLGRRPAERWAPRLIDLDLLLFGSESLSVPSLAVPHPELAKRAFVLDPLKDLAPGLRLPGDSRTVLERAREHPAHAPLWMGILNLTPDSFSDGGALAAPGRFAARAAELEEAGAAILDLGAESTRPGATPVTPEEEWRRLEPALRCLQESHRGSFFRPLVSVDTRHARTAARAIELGARIINDVSGLADPAMARVLAGSGCDYVLMHSLSVPADGARVLPESLDPVAEILAWAGAKLGELARAGVSPDRVLFDPGVGFGKTPAQSLEILRGVRRFRSLGTRLLVGHSRKSFLNAWGERRAADRDWESAGVSLRLASEGVDVLRVHEPALHARAFRAFQGTLCLP